MRPRDDGLGSWVRRRAGAAPDDVAIVFGGVRRTYAETAGRIDRLSAVFRARGVERGDRIAYHGPNHPLALESLLAAAALGAVWVPILPGRDPADVRFILDDAGVRLLVRGEVEGPPPPVATLASNDVDRQLASMGGATPSDVPVALADLALLGYTSGTTGRPKGTMLTHANLTWNVVNVLSVCPIGARDRALALAPMTRLGGLGVLVLETIFAGGTVVVPHDMRPAAVLETIRRERVTLLFANPTALAGLAVDAAWARTDLSSLRVVIVGGDVVPEPLLRTYLDRGVPLRHGYGLTEAAPVVTILDDRDAPRKFGSVGRAIGLVEVAIEGSDGGELPAGATGEILVRGPNVTAGYWKRPDATAEALRPDGWWRTGDAGWLDEDGCLYVVDRIREGFLVGGERVFPAQIERVLQGDPDVQDAAAAGTPDGIVLCVVPRTEGAIDPARLLDRMRRALPPSLVPQRVRIVAGIPRNAAGKIVRERVRALADAHDA